MKYNLLLDVEGHGIHSTAVKDVSYEELKEEGSTFPVLETFFKLEEGKDSTIKAFATVLKKQWEKIVGYKEVHKVTMAFSKEMKEKFATNHLDSEQLVAALKDWFSKEKLYELKRAEYSLVDAEYAFVKGAICRNGLIYQRILGFHIGNDLTMIQIKDGTLFQNKVEAIKTDVLKQLSLKYYGMELSSLELCRKAEEKNKNAIDCLNEFGQIVFETVQKVIDQTSTDAVVLGGRMLKSQRYFLDLLYHYIHEKGIDVITESNMTQMVFLGLAFDNNRSV